MIPCFIDAGVAEWVDAVDLKSAEPLARAGSTPALGIEPDNDEDTKTRSPKVLGGPAPRRALALPLEQLPRLTVSA